MSFLRWGFDIRVLKTEIGGFDLREMRATALRDSNWIPVGEPWGIAVLPLSYWQNPYHQGLAYLKMGFIPPDNFNLALLTLELEFVKKGTKNELVDAVLLAMQLKQRFINQVMTAGQRVSFEYHGNNYIFTVNQAVLEGQEGSNAPERGLISNETYIIFEASNSSGIKIVNQREAASSNIFRQKEFNLLSLGIGGLSNEFADIFRRAFASRVFPPHVTSKLGIKHVKGMLLYGPPGTGKTLMARQIGKMLNGREPKIVNGPEVLSKFVGETEKNVRDLFADAENDQRTRGDQSDLHVIIFDEIDAICKSRGSTRDGTGVHDSIVNQLLTKGKKLLVLGTTSEMSFLESVGICDAFCVSYQVPKLKTDDVKKVLEQLNVFAGEDIDAAAEALNDIPIKKVYMLIEMAAQGEQGGAAEAIYSGKEKIKIAHFYDCLQDVVNTIECPIPIIRADFEKE
ncbi:hypothetical protein SLEP1_g22214 [Rubroshorea leprosula]|uniref:Vesicle-fusing ATPase n=1 Tax=Rubroshorea leprosula TaxID=152421 RepID=A0AAV5JFS2_9ROSI|nr:hypothetical protein SLEP1_g22214 [Rubroshorea leprosula]